MAVLVTGGAGYIGSHTAVALHEAGREVVLIDNFDNSSAAAVDAIRALTTSDMAFHEGDLRDRSLLDHIFETCDIDEVVHFAGYKRSGECDDSARVLRQQSWLHDRARRGHGRARCAQARLLVVVHGLWPA